MKKLGISAALLGLVLGAQGTAGAAVTLYGITGNQEADKAGATDLPDETLFAINTGTGAMTTVKRLSYIPDTDAIGWNPMDGQVYHVSGSSEYRDRTTQLAFNPNQYMEKYDVGSDTLTAVFNSNPHGLYFNFGLNGPRPSWVLPAEQRVVGQNPDNSFPPDFDPRENVAGDNEYDSIREMVWSPSQQAFIAATHEGMFKLTPGGDSTFLSTSGVTGEPKAIAYATVGGVRKLYYTWSADKDQGTNSYFEVGADWSAIEEKTFTPDASFGGTVVLGILGLAEHPDSGELYAVVREEGAETVSTVNPARAVPNHALAILNPTTGVLTKIGMTGLHTVSIEFGGWRIGDMNGDSATDNEDIAGFVQALVDPAGYAAAFPGLNANRRANAAGSIDANGFDTFDNEDIAGFVTLLLGGAPASAVPEPSTVTLLVLGGLGALAFRRRA
jgi:PEP-CTERM motif